MIFKWLFVLVFSGVPEEESILSKEATGNESLPPNGYIVPGKMRLGSINVPAPNSVHLRRDSILSQKSQSSQKLTPFRSDSVTSGSSSSFMLPKSRQNKEALLEMESSSVSERESISPHRLMMPHEEVITKERSCCLNYDR